MSPVIRVLMYYWSSSSAMQQRLRMCPRVDGGGCRRWRMFANKCTLFYTFESSIVHCLSSTVKVYTRSVSVFLASQRHLRFFSSSNLKCKPYMFNHLGYLTDLTDWRSLLRNTIQFLYGNNGFFLGFEAAISDQCLALCDGLGTDQTMYG